MEPKHGSANYFTQGNAFRQKGEYQQAINWFRKGVELDPTYSRGWMNLGVLLKDVGDYKESETCLKNALELDPAYGDAWFNLGTLYMRKLGNNEEALKCLKEAIRCNPEDEEAVGFAAEALQRLGRLGDATDLLDKAIAEHPNFHQMKQMREGLAAAFRQYLEDIANGTRRKT